MIAAAGGPDREHSAVVATNVGLKPGDSVVVGNARQMPIQQRLDARALVLVKHRQRDLCS